VTGAGGFGRGDVVERAHLLGRRAHDHGEAVPFEEAEHQDDDAERVADHRDDGERHEHHRQREPRRDDEGDDHVDPAAEIAGGEAERGADRPEISMTAMPISSEMLRAVESAREIVAAEIVGAERMRPGAAPRTRWAGRGGC
jgi:hypothetical protein